MPLGATASNVPIGPPRQEVSSVCSDMLSTKSTSTRTTNIRVGGWVREGRIRWGGAGSVHSSLSLCFHVINAAYISRARDKAYVSCPKTCCPLPNDVASAQADGNQAALDLAHDRLRRVFPTLYARNQGSLRRITPAT